VLQQPALTDQAHTPSPGPPRQPSDQIIVDQTRQVGATRRRLHIRVHSHRHFGVLFV
jgi:hypothetical protein